MTKAPRLVIFSTPDELGRAVADWMLRQAVAAPDRIAIALSGGSTPISAYRRFADADFAARFPWPRAHWFWGDERFVPPDNPRSNFKLAWDCFLSRVPAPPENIHRVETEHTTPEAAAARYERELKQFYGADSLSNERPLLHMNLLGIGENGHFASLFPGGPALEERVRWTAATMNDGEPRITLTYPALESSAHAAFMVSGSAKADILAKVITGDAALPAARYHPAGEFCVFADEAAAKAVATNAAARGTVSN